MANKLPKVPKLELVLYHWSPTRNRNQIKKYGLQPSQRSLQGDWKPPYVCFSDEPWIAWLLSGRYWPDIKSWDLWMCYTPSQTSFDHYEIITDTFPDTGRTYTKEYRIYTRIYKRDLIYIGSRTHQNAE